MPILIPCESVCPLIRAPGGQILQCQLHLMHTTPHMATVSKDWSDEEGKRGGKEEVILLWFAYETP